jgi:site-specific recombinase XerD
MDSIVEEALDEYLESRAIEIPVLFVSKKSGSLIPRTIQYMIKKSAKAANINKNVTPHKLRHTCAMPLLQEGAHSLDKNEYGTFLQK